MGDSDQSIEKKSDKIIIMHHLSHAEIVHLQAWHYIYALSEHTGCYVGQRVYRAPIWCSDQEDQYVPGKPGAGGLSQTQRHLQRSIYSISSGGKSPVRAFRCSQCTFFRWQQKWPLKRCCCVTHNEWLQGPQWRPRTPPPTDMLIHTHTHCHVWHSKVLFEAVRQWAAVWTR